MSDIDPAIVMAAHANEQDPMYRWWYCPACGKAGIPDRCEPYRLAEALAATLRERDEWETASRQRGGRYLRRAKDAEVALAAEQAKVARMLAVHARYFDLDGRPGFDDCEPEPEDVWRYDRDLRAAVADQTEQAT